MIDHITISVRNLIKSKIFYEKTLSPLGYNLAFGQEEKFWAFDIGNGALFEIAQFKDKCNPTSCHIAFRANSQDQVHQFYKTAISAGAICNGAPGPRPQYTANYYAAFVLDPDGHNIEAVFDDKKIEMKKTALDVIHELDVAFNSGNLDQVLSFYEDNATIVLEPGKIISGKTRLREAFSSILKLKGKATQLKTNLIESNNVSLFTSHWRFEWVSTHGDKMTQERVANTVLRKNQNGEWRILIDNSFGPAVLEDR